MDVLRTGAVMVMLPGLTSVGVGHRDNIDRRLKSTLLENIE